MTAFGSARANPVATVGTTRATLESLGATGGRGGIELRAWRGNSGDIFVGDVTVSSNGTTGNFFGFLAAGESLSLDVPDASRVYVVGSGAGQRLYVGAMA